MPLLDHFRPPLSEQRHWHAFHNAWATYLASSLNRHLPRGYFAEANVQFGIEIDVATFEETHREVIPCTTASAGAWTPPQPAQTVPFNMPPEHVEVTIFNRKAGPVLAGAIELVSPGNKDRPANRDAFVSKCLTYLQQGVGLVIVDIVTGRAGNLHNELMGRAGGAAAAWNAALYAAAYRPVQRADQVELNLWLEELSVGRLLPTMPLWLLGGLCLPVELESTYERTCQEQRVSAEAV